MLDDPRNDEIAYVFSTYKTPMEMLGLWPLCEKTTFVTTRWGLTTIMQLTSFVFIFMDFNGSQGADANIESIMFFICITASVLKSSCVTINRTKLTKNMNAIISDWLIAKNDKESHQIMERYASRSKLLAIVMIYTAYIALAIYVIGVVLINLKQIFLHNTDVPNADSVNETNRVFILPSGELGNKISGPLYTVIIVLQTLQIHAIGLTQCTLDSFYITVVLHLAGQFEVLKMKFSTFTNKPNTDMNYRKRFIGLVNRHCELMEFIQNLEDTFHLVILYQLVTVTLLLALLGLRVIFFLREGYYVLLVRNITCLNFLLGEALIYTYGGDFIQRESEDIFHAMFMTSWFTFPSALMKDLYFAMMKSYYPCRLTGGKFFYANRETMLNVLKTAASYISVLRVTLQY